MTRTRTRWYRQIPFPAISVVISLGVGVVLWATKITGELAAILSALVLELVIVSHRLLYNSEKAADPLRGLLRTAEIDRALDSAREIIKSGNPHARALLDGTATAFAERVTDLNSGGVNCSPSEFMEFMEGLLASARTGDKLSATSHLAGGEYWARKYGRQYEELNREAHDKGLTIERIYMLRDVAHLERVRPILDRQSEFSEIRIVLLDGLDESVSAPRRDFFVYGDDVAAEFHFTEPDMVVDHITVTTRRDAVRERAKEYVRIRRAFSEPYATAPAKTPDA
ncbi:hypothetical protein GCM10023403_57670 [Pseudonocardia benzenivorans]|nr:hypothetical protein PSD17_67040 [Pseudonocardia sp. D17]